MHWETKKICVTHFILVVWNQTPNIYLWGMSVLPSLSNLPGAEETVSFECYISLSFLGLCWYVIWGEFIVLCFPRYSRWSLQVMLIKGPNAPSRREPGTLLRLVHFPEVRMPTMEFCCSGRGVMEPRSSSTDSSVVTPWFFPASLAYLEFALFSDNLATIELGRQI